MERLLAGQPGTVHLTIYNEDGVAVDATGSVAVVVYDDANNDLVTATATKTANTTGQYTYTVSKTITEDLGSYYVEWTYTLNSISRTTKTHFESVGGFLFEIPELRAYNTDLADTSTYTAAMIRDARVAAEQRFETAAKVAFVPRARTVTLSGDDTTRIVVPDSELRLVYAASIDGTELTQEELDYLEVDASGVIRRNDNQLWPSGFKNVVLTYEHGYDTVPGPVKKAVMRLAYEELVPSSLNPRATSISTDLGEFRLSTANPDAGRWTGIPEVDAIAKDFGRSRPTVG